MDTEAYTRKNLFGRSFKARVDLLAKTFNLNDDFRLPVPPVVLMSVPWRYHLVVTFLV